MRVGLFTASLSAGGAERQAALWARACTEQGLEAEVLALHRFGPEYALPAAVPVHEVGKRGALDLARIVREVRRLAARVDIVVAFQPYLAIFCAFGRLRTPWLLVTGEDPRRFGDTSRVPGQLLRAAVRRAPLRTAPTAGLVDCHRRLGLGDDCWEVVPNIAAEEAFAGDDARPRGGALWVGRLVPEKDPGLAVEVARQAGVPLTILGDGPLRAELEPHAGDGVELVPFDPAPWHLYATHRALLLTSRYEAFGNVIVEALAAGTPVVAGDCDFGPREVLAGLRASRVVPRATDELAVALRTVAEQEPSNKVRRECRERAERYGVAALGPRIVEVLRAVPSRA